MVGSLTILSPVSGRSRYQPYFSTTVAPADVLVQVTALSLTMRMFRVPVPLPTATPSLVARVCSCNQLRVTLGVLSALSPAVCRSQMPYRDIALPLPTTASDVSKYLPVPKITSRPVPLGCLTTRGADVIGWKPPLPLTAWNNGVPPKEPLKLLVAVGDDASPYGLLAVPGANRSKRQRLPRISPA
ncbi:hypothetical protein D3C81_1222320 [compost metagenome]